MNNIFPALLFKRKPAYLVFYISSYYQTAHL